MSFPIDREDIATEILEYVRRLAEPPKSVPKMRALHVRIALLPTVLQWPVELPKPLDFIVHVTNGTPKEVKEGLARRFEDRFKNMPPALQFTEDPENEVQHTVPIRLFCADLYGCDPERLPLLDPAGGNIVQPACPSDLVVFQICCLAQVERGKRAVLNVAIRRLMCPEEDVGRVKLTVRQLQLVRNFLPDLDRHNWPTIAWKLNLGVSRLQPNPRQRINTSSEEWVNVEMIQ